ncbi:biotin synthase BioB [Hwanghaeella grinnelliae]|uniref:Biotin synthase n=1 Tax=Hwanghaeella grinnelliae TaxID=2500179 RepID=A0A437QKZ9_9PROT|nr:biotin synthase BioB [Hwanghaeella grinnelliae]RVU35171.1 biotin synthase BioB [Hwanghaeella grinnelliae]
MISPVCRHDWSLSEVQELFALPFMDLIHQAQAVHRAAFDPNEVQLSSLMSIKTGGCPEDCAYCPQSAHYETGLEKERLAELDRVLNEARAAKERGASRFCMGAAWKRPNARDFPLVLEMVRGVKELGMESCVTLGALDRDQVAALKEVGLDYYNHNLDTSREHYEKIITTRSFQDRLDTLTLVRDSGINVCCGGILGLGEEEEDRAKLLMELANLPHHPESVPINLLVKAQGTPLEGAADVDPFDFVRAVAVARILMPKSYVRLSAGRSGMDDALQALCFLAGANSIFFGEKLLTTPNAGAEHDKELLERLGMKSQTLEEIADSDGRMAAAR